MLDFCDRSRVVMGDFGVRSLMYGVIDRGLRGVVLVVELVVVGLLLGVRSRVVRGD
jgi:hypothetical protein